MAERKRLLELAIRGLKHELVELEREFMGAARTYGKAVAPALVGRRRRRRRMSAAAKRAISLAQKARWAKRRGKAAVSAAGKTAGKKVRRVSAAARKAAAERMRAYWAKRKAAKK